MKFYKICFLVILSAIFLANHIFVESVYGHKGKKKSRKMLLNLALRHSNRLGLNISQITKLRSLRTNFKKSRIMNRAKLGIMRIDLNSLIRTEPMKMKEIQKLVKKLTSQKEIMLMARIETIAKTKNILTNVQLEEIKKIRKKLRKRRMRSRRNRKK